MRGVEPGESHLVVHFDTDEAGLLAGTVDQLVELLGDPGPVATVPEQSGLGADDPFAQWEAEFRVEQAPAAERIEELDDEPDPVLARLFPDACPEDPAVSADFRRYTQAEQRRQKVADARLVVRDLQRTDRRGRCRVPQENVTAWLRTLTAVRLALAVRLGITDETSADEVAQLPEQDPRSWLHEVFQWVGWLQECLIAAL